MKTDRTRPENPLPFLIGLAALLGYSFVSRSEMPVWIRVVAALAGGSSWLYFLHRAERQRLQTADELELRIRAEGRALGLNILIAILLLWVPLDRALLLPIDCRVLALFAIAAYAFGPWLARRRYQ